jgi:uncharacterized membrane protein YfcA
METTTDDLSPSPAIVGCRVILDDVYLVLFSMCLICIAVMMVAGTVASEMGRRQKKDWEEWFKAIFNAFLGGFCATIVTTLVLRIVTKS